MTVFVPRSLNQSLGQPYSGATLSPVQGIKVDAPSMEKSSRVTISLIRSQNTGGFTVKLSRTFVALVLGTVLASVAVAQDKSTGGIKGKVRVETGSPGGVAVVIREGEREVGRVLTEKNGNFHITRLKPGFYGLTFRKPGLSVGTIESIEVKAGKTKSLGDRLILTIDEGSIAFVRGSVFNADGRSVPGAKIELFRILADGSTRKIDGRVTNETGSFVFRLVPETAKYRVSVKAEGREPVSKDIEVDGAAVYRVALALDPAKKEL